MEKFLFSIFPTENFVDLNLYQCGFEVCRPSHSYGPASRNHYLFHYIISGKGTLFAQDQNKITYQYQVTEGQGFLIFPGQITTYIADYENPWQYMWLEFDGMKAHEAIQLSGLSKKQPIYHSISPNLQSVMKDEMNYIIHHKDQSTFNLMGHLYLFLDHMIRSCMGNQKKEMNKLQDYYIKEALTYIEQNYQQDITIEAIAEHCGLTRSYFGKIFKQSIGQTPQNFLLKYRMVKASELLKTSNMSLGEISQIIGYHNQFHFSRAFKNIYGISPQKWRIKSKQ